jgi:hypothetical protein
MSNIMNGSPISLGLQQLRRRALSGGGFGIQTGGDFRPDATAWAVIALHALGTDSELIGAARQRLARVQLGDGRVSLALGHPEDYWPTPLAMLAWQGDPAYQESQKKAAAFLLATSGLHWKKEPGSAIGHDPNLQGWSWLSDTSSWTEPTSMAMMALEVTGYGNNPRLTEAQRLLLDRQLPGGGWNYGNTTVYGHVLNPMPESTGMALNALSHKVSRETVQKSLVYLEASVNSLKTPWSLGWALLGLGAWGAKPPAARAAIEFCLGREERFHGYDTSSLALLLVASRATAGLVSLYQA